MGILNKYRNIIGKEKLEEIKIKAAKLKGKHILNINSTYQGGGVAEILNRLIPLMNELGIDAGWRILHGSPNFFTTTKKFFNSLQSDEINLSEQKKQTYINTNKRFSTFTHIDHDCVIIHDIQPLPLIKFFKKRQPWIWRCHTDLSKPNKKIINYLKKFINKYDVGIFLSKKYLQPSLKIKQIVMPPSIDPLSIKNKELSKKTIKKCIKKYKIPTDKPIICQVSRFDKWKDHEGVIKIFKLIKKEVNCRLILIGCSALDDPMGQSIYENIKQKTCNDKDIIVFNLMDDVLVNCLQTISKVIIQKSIKEGFGLTISEALWKKTPVIASSVGGISDQIIEGRSGYLLDPFDIEGFARRTIELLKNDKLREEMGLFGKEYVKQNFLITTHLSNYIDIIIDALNKK